jgi:hypothetical protein
MTIKIDLKQASRIVKTKQGFRADRTALISYDPDMVTITADTALYNAITDGSLPSIGDAHPHIASIYLQSLTCDPLALGEYIVTMVYEDVPGFPLTSNNLKRVSATTAPGRIEKDATQPTPVEMWALYMTKAGDAADPEVMTKENFAPNIEKPRASFEFEYTVDDGLGTTPFPQSTIDNYLGKVNLAVWNGYPVRSVMCSAVNITQQGEGYRVAITFLYNSDLWEYNALIAIPIDQLAPSIKQTDPTLNFDTGVKNFKVYPEVDFTALGLTL